MYSAINIAKYIINKCIELNRPISNLQLQKILYYVQGEYIKLNNGKILFDDDIMAWKYGPVVPTVYYEFNQYSSSDIDTEQENEVIENHVKNIIDPVIINKSMLSAWKLVEDTHNELPWKTSYQIGQDIIEISTMKDFFVNDKEDNK